MMIIVHDRNDGVLDGDRKFLMKAVVRLKVSKIYKG